MQEAPLFVDAYDLALTLGQQFDQPNDQPSHLAARIVATGFDLLEEITLALKGYEPEAHADSADERLAVLRVQLRLAMDLGLVERAKFLQTAEQIDTIGRQLGGWLKRLREV